MISVLTVVKEIYRKSITSVINVREFTVEAFNMKNYFPENILFVGECKLKLYLC